MKILLTVPPYTAWTESKQHLRRVGGIEPCSGITSLAAYLRERDGSLELRLIDSLAAGFSRARLLEEITRWAPQVLCLSVPTVCSSAAAELAREVSKRLPGTVIIAGGPHVSGAAEAFLQTAPEIDYGVIGEGEVTLAELIKMVRDGGGPGAVRGLVYRDKAGKYVRTPPRELIEDLDALPLPAWDLLDGFPGSYNAPPFFNPGGPMCGLAPSRGCMFQCSFCFKGTFGSRCRSMSARRVGETVDHLQRKYGIKYFIFYDDIFTADRDRALEICRHLGALRPGTRWSCDAHVASVDRELLRAMKSSGCWSVSYGLESGSPAVLKSLNKHFALEKARQSVRETAEEGILAKGLFMMGTPEESLETIRETRDFIASLPLSTLNVSKFTPYPGVPLAESLPGLNDQRAWDSMNGMNFIVPSRHLSIEELEREYWITIRSFYEKWKNRKTHARIVLGSRENLRILLGMVPGLLRGKFGSSREKK